MAEKIKIGLTGAVIGAIVLAIVGFTWGGWITASALQEKVRDAIVARLVPICVAQSSEDPGKVQKLADLKKEQSWERDDYVVKQGWATMPGETQPADGVAEPCAEKLV